MVQGRHKKGSAAEKKMLNRRKVEARLKLKRARDLAKKNAATAKKQSIGKIPTCENPERRAKAASSFRFFCETYLAEIFYMPWSKDLLRVIAKVERVVVNHDTLAVVMPRGSGKTQLCLASALWAYLTARHPFVVYVGAVNAAAKEGIEYFKKQLSENPMLLEDWPEVCYPFAKLDGAGGKARGQRLLGGKLTEIEWKPNMLVAPKVPGSLVSGAVIAATSMTGRIKGMWRRLPDGKIVRPSLAIVDDPQTDESARSQGPNSQTEYRLKIINHSIRGMAGPDGRLAILVPCTVIERGDSCK